MTTQQNSWVSTLVWVGIVALGVTVSYYSVAIAQQSTSTATASANHQANWNTPSMLRARAWLQDYCSGNALSEAEAAQHMQALESMTPAQMKLFALRHSEAEKNHPTAKVQQLHQQAVNHASQALAAQEWWQKNVHKAESARALAGDAATQRNLSDISQEETAAAIQAQAQVNTEQAAARENQDAKLDDLNTEYTGAGFGYGYGYGYGDGGPAYHFHFYPGP